MLLTHCDFFRSAPNVKVVRITKHARVDCGSNEESLGRLPNVLISALNVEVGEIQTSADPAVFWLRARHLCFLDCRAPQSSEITRCSRQLPEIGRRGPQERPCVARRSDGD